MDELGPAQSFRKVLTRDQLLRVRQELRTRHSTLVQCHGCFDIVHPGHLRHLRQARALGDCLLVTITSDVLMGKGDGRPLIPQELRAENLAALDVVDYVFIDDHPTAADLLALVKPDVYVKGKEYESNQDPRFARERAVVEEAGGRVVFTSGDVVFSSSALIAAMDQSVDPYSQRVRQLCAKEELSTAELSGVVSRMKGKHVVVIGESIIDSYVLCDRPDVASESPVMTLRPVEARQYDGGAAILARHAAALGARATLVTLLPFGQQAQEFANRMQAEGVRVLGVLAGNSLPEKQRYLVGAQKVMKIDLVQRYVLDEFQHEELLRTALVACEGSADACIIADFGLGLFSRGSLEKVASSVRPATGILTGDVSGRRSNLPAFRGMDLVCPSEHELRDALQAHDESLPNVACRLLDTTHSRNIIVTLGAEGLVAFSRREQAVGTYAGFAQQLSGEHIPALTPVALDQLGCGDALLATATLSLASGASLLQAAMLGTCAAGLEVQRLGNIPVSACDLRQSVLRLHRAHLALSLDQPVPARTPAMAS